MKDENKIPRRINTLEWTPAELAISKAMEEVEKAGADVRLTNAILYLQQAKNAVADFVDGVELGRTNTFDFDGDEADFDEE